MNAKKEAKKFDFLEHKRNKSSSFPACLHVASLYGTRERGPNHFIINAKLLRYL